MSSTPAQRIRSQLWAAGWRRAARAWSRCAGALPIPPGEPFTMWEFTDGRHLVSIIAAGEALVAFERTGGGQDRLICNEYEVFSRKPTDTVPRVKGNDRRKKEHVRLNPAELARIKEAAQLAGSEGWSTYMRDVVLQHCDVVLGVT